MADLERIDAMWDDYQELYSAQGWGQDNKQAQLHSYASYVAEIVADDNCPPMSFLTFVREQYAIDRNYEVEVVAVWAIDAATPEQAAEAARERMAIEGLPLTYNVVGPNGTTDEITLETRD